ncbi:hypothetical protein AB1N83_000262 [Pleurotus pulmonarius]
MMVIGRGISRASQYSGYISNSAGDLLTPDRLTATSSLDTTVTKGLKLCPTSRIDQRSCFSFAVIGRRLLQFINSFVHIEELVC